MTPSDKPLRQKQAVGSSGFGPDTWHLCSDMQHLFAQGGAWDLPWLEKIRAQVVRLSRFNPAHTIFTRFIPPFTPSEAKGKWRDYYERWPQVTRHVLPSRQLELLPELVALTPPAYVIDKMVYSPWHDTTLGDLVQSTGTKRLIVSGGETEICVACPEPTDASVFQTH